MTKEESKDEEIDPETADETVFLKKYDENQKNTHHSGGTRGNDSEEEDEDDGSGGQRVGCQAQ